MNFTLMIEFNTFEKCYMLQNLIKFKRALKTVNQFDIRFLRIKRFFK